MKAEEVGSARWLPLACDPNVHGKVDVEKEHDLAFVGNIFPGPREELLQAIPWPCQLIRLEESPPQLARPANLKIVDQLRGILGYPSLRCRNEVQPSAHA